MTHTLFLFRERLFHPSRPRRCSCPPCRSRCQVIPPTSPFAGEKLAAPEDPSLTRCTRGRGSRQRRRGDGLCLPCDAHHLGERDSCVVGEKELVKSRKKPAGPPWAVVATWQPCPERKLGEKTSAEAPGFCDINYQFSSYFYSSCYLHLEFKYMLRNHREAHRDGRPLLPMRW